MQKELNGLKSQSMDISSNKKIKNATPTEYNGIKFKSRLEVMTYKTLIEAGFNPVYEIAAIELWKGFKPTVPFYDRNSKKMFVSNDKKEISIKYSPDFQVIHNGVQAFIEVKGGQVNDVFYIKRKLFRKWLEDNQEISPFKFMYFIVHTKKEVLEVINIIKSYKHEEKSI